MNIQEKTKKEQDMAYEILLNKRLTNIKNEVSRAKSLHPGDFHNLHEGYAVLLEEVDELWDEIKKKKPSLEEVRKEAEQVAAMALRIIVELT